MWLSLILLFLLAGITIRQSVQGLFSSLIMAVLSICCAALAIGTYEWVAVHVAAQYWKPDFAMAVSLGMVYGLSLSILYTVFSLLVKRAGLLPSWVDRLGGGVCGFITAMISVGIFALCLQMLPFDRGSILGYARIYTPDLMLPVEAGSLRGDDQQELLLRPDRFVVGLVAVLSHGTFSNGDGFFDENPDLVQAVGWAGATSAMVSRYAPPNSISFDGSAPVEVVYKTVPGDDRRGIAETFEPLEPGAGDEFRMVRVMLRDEARDANKSHIFTLRQFRLVGYLPGTRLVSQFHPVAIRQDDTGDGELRYIRFKAVSGVSLPVANLPFSPGSGGNKVEVVFELPKGFTPTFLEYKRAARAAVSFAKGVQPEQTARTTPPVSTKTSLVSSNKPGSPSPTPANRRVRRARPSRKPNEGTRSRRRGGRVRGVSTKEGGSFFGGELPFPLRSYQRIQNVDVSNGKLVSGHLAAVVDAQSEASGPSVDKFFVPPDKRLLQLHSTRLHAGSAFGKALSFAVTTIQNYFVQDARGNRYTLAGKYSIAPVGGKETLEVEYYSGPVGSIGGIGQFTKINEKQLTDKDPYVLLFLVDPGAHIVSFSTGGAATRKDDLLADNLVAPK